MEVFLTGEGLIALLTLTFLEIVLGVDNIIFISIVSNRLPENQQAKARNIGLGLALLFRVGLLLGISWIIKLDSTIFEIDILGKHLPFSWKSIILLLGGLFLLGKSTTEIHHKLEGKSEEHSDKKPSVISAVILQIVFLDIIFSIDSILTAVGLAEDVQLMIAAVIISMIVMMLFAGKISSFINKHPSLQLLALSFLILIGFTLVLEALHVEVPKGYIYFSVFFSLTVEILNMRFRRKNGRKVDLNKRIEK